MSDAKGNLPDGEYACQATLHVRDGKVLVVIHNPPKLEIGTTIPLLREQNNFVMEGEAEGITKRLGILNGHGII